ncbi:hypothetical protein C1S82_18715 [Mycolicibacterium cosmeticum]|nr:hypothetical protein C1S82_18715 [Mycolicibacterium cosmeticum]
MREKGCIFDLVSQGEELVCLCARDEAQGVCGVGSGGEPCSIMGPTRDMMTLQGGGRVAARHVR